MPEAKIRSFQCACDAELPYPLPGTDVNCNACGRMYLHEKSVRDGVTWGRIVEARGPWGIPDGWNSISHAPHRTFLLLLCESQTVNLPFVVLTGKLDPEYRPFWVDEGGDALLDGGYKPIAYRYLSDLNVPESRIERTAK